MSYLTLAFAHAQHDRPLVWLHGEIRSPPFSAAARVEAGTLLRLLQRGERLDPDAVVILEVFAKKTARTPKHVIETCRARLRRYDNA